MNIEEETDTKQQEKIFGNLIPLNPSYPKISLCKEHTIVGRKRGCDFRLMSLRISGRHALITYEPEKTEFSIQDMSSNGTWLNSKRLVLGKPTLLNHGDEISFIPSDGEQQEGLYSVAGIIYIFHDLTQQSNEHLVVEMEEAGVRLHHEFVKPLGQGSFGEVWLTRKRSSNEHCAAKVMCKKKYIGLTGNLAPIFEEVKILSRLCHPNICAVFDAYETPGHLVVILELASGGDLSDLIHSHPSGIPENRAKQCFSQIIEALEYLHSKDIVHRDLKSDNVLVADTNKLLLKLTDFGLSRLIGNESLMKTVCGTPFYLAPEIIQHGISAGQGYSEKVDLWSAGIILYQLLTGRLPISTDTDAPPLHTQILEVLHPKFKLPVPAQISEPAGEVLQHLLVRSTQRWGASQAANCRWLKPQRDLKRAYTDVRSKFSREATLDAASALDLKSPELQKILSVPSLSRESSNLKRTRKFKESHEHI